MSEPTHPDNTRQTPTFRPIGDAPTSPPVPQAIRVPATRSLLPRHGRFCAGAEEL